MAERFYVSSPLAPGPVVLEGAEAHHLARVRRLAAGDLVCLFNGDGFSYHASIRRIGKQDVELEVLALNPQTCELPFTLIAACPLPKGDRGGFLIEKLTELGVMAYVPLRTARSIVHPIKTEKLERWVIEASKQCGRNVLMRIDPVQDWAAFVSRQDLPGRRLLGDRYGKEWDWRAAPAADAVIAVGPEGGITDEERDLALRAGWELLGLGDRTLRIETAAMLLAGALSLTSKENR